MVGVILATGEGHPDLEHPFFQEVLVGLKHTVGTLGFDLLLFSVEPLGNGSGPSGEPRYLSRVRQHRVDGVVLMGVDRHDPQVEELVASGTPIMSVDLDLQGGRTGHVTSDNVTGASLAVRHLAELGHERIGLIGGPSTTRPGVDRLLGYRRELERQRLPYEPAFVREGDFYPESGFRAMRELIDLPEPPTAVFAAADLMAAGALRALNGRGMSCPADLSLVGFDDVHLAGLLQPALTTIRQDMRGLGAAAGKSLIDMIEDPEATPPVVVEPVELVVRDSTATGPRGRNGSATRGGTSMDG